MMLRILDFIAEARAILLSEALAKMIDYQGVFNSGPLQKKGNDAYKLNNAWN